VWTTTRSCSSKAYAGGSKLPFCGLKSGSISNDLVVHGAQRRKGNTSKPAAGDRPVNVAEKEVADAVLEGGDHVAEGVVLQTDGVRCRQAERADGA